MQSHSRRYYLYGKKRSHCIMSTSTLLRPKGCGSRHHRYTNHPTQRIYLKHRWADNLNFWRHDQANKQQRRKEQCDANQVLSPPSKNHHQDPDFVSAADLTPFECHPIRLATPPPWSTPSTVPTPHVHSVCHTPYMIRSSKLMKILATTPPRRPVDTIPQGSILITKDGLSDTGANVSATKTSP